MARLHFQYFILLAIRSRSLFAPGVAGVPSVGRVLSPRVASSAPLIVPEVIVATFWNLFGRKISKCEPGIAVRIVRLLDLGRDQLAQDGGALPPSPWQLGDVPVYVEGVVPAVVCV